MKPTIGTVLFVILLTVSPVAAVNTQNAAQPASANAIITTPATPDVAAASDAKTQQRIARAIKKIDKIAREVQKIDQNVEEVKTQAAAQSQTQTNAQRAREKAAADKQIAEQRAVKAQADTLTRQRVLGAIIVAGSLTLVILAILLVRRDPQAKLNNSTAVNAPIAESRMGSAPENLYGRVKAYLENNHLREGRFTIYLPQDDLSFEYLAEVMPDGNIMAYFSGNEKPVAIEAQKLRRVAKKLFDQGKLTPKPTGIRQVS